MFIEEEEARKRGYEKLRELDKEFPKIQRAVDELRYFTIEFTKDGKRKPGKLKLNLLVEDLLKDNQFFSHGPRTPLYRYHPKKGIWIPDGVAYIRKRIRQLAGKNIKRFYIEEIVSAIQDLSYSETLPTSTNPHKLVVANGVLDLTQRELLPFDPDLYALSALPVTYDPDAQCPRIEQFIDEVAPEDKDTLQEWVGFHLWRAYPFHKAMMLLGEGANGKSTFLNLLKALLGKENVSNIGLYDLNMDRFAKAQLYGKLANISPDLPAKRLTVTGTFKALTGEDSISAQFKYHPHFIFQNHAKLSFSANKLPSSVDLSKAFFRRWLIIRFPHIFEGETCDPDLLTKLKTELSGFLNWALDGLARLLATQTFSTTKTSTDIEDEYIQLSDSALAFIRKYLKPARQAKTLKSLIWDAYEDYCELYDLEKLSKTTFGRRLSTTYRYVRTIRHGPQGKREYYWVGVALRNIDEETGDLAQDQAFLPGFGDD